MTPFHLNRCKFFSSNTQAKDDSWSHKSNNKGLLLVNSQYIIIKFDVVVRVGCLYGSLTYSLNELIILLHILGGQFQRPTQ